MNALMIRVLDNFLLMDARAYKEEREYILEMANTRRGRNVKVYHSLAEPYVGGTVSSIIRRLSLYSPFDYELTLEEIALVVKEADRIREL